jgi:hypothetical protein
MYFRGYVLLAESGLHGKNVLQKKNSICCPVWVRNLVSEIRDEYSSSMFGNEVFETCGNQTIRRTK